MKRILGGFAAPHALVAAVLAAVLVVVFAASSAAAKDTAAEEAKLRTQTAAEVAKVAAACATAGAKTDAAKLVDEATALDAAAAGVSDAKDKADALDADQAGSDAAAAKARAAARANVAKLYDKLAALDHEAKDEARFVDYLMRAIEWEPKPRAGAVIKKAKASLDSPQPWTGARLLARVRKADPEGAKKGLYDAGEADLGKSSKLMLASQVNDYVVWVSLPKDWKKGGTYPVLMGVEGAGCNFTGYLNGMVAARGSRNVIVVTPVSLSNTNADKISTTTYPMYDPAFVDACKNDVGKRLEFEGAGWDAILADLHLRFGAEEKAFHTGFSGGGIFTYWRVFHAPAKVRGAAPSCGNFSEGLATGGPGAGDGGGPPVHVLTGEKDEHREFTFGNKDSPGIEPQTDLAIKAFEREGFKHVRRTMVPAVGHSAQPAKVWEFVDEVLSGKAK